jgi:hypothetical protein
MTKENIMNAETSTEVMLNVGDNVYQYGNYGVNGKYTVEKVTPKQATLSNGHTVRRELVGENQITHRVKGISEWERGLYHYRLESPACKSDWFRKSAIKFLNDYNFANCTNDQLVEVLAKLNTEVV